jgi:hypothetical protein
MVGVTVVVLVLRDAGPTDTVTVNDVAIVGNEFVGPFGEDAIRLNRYHDANGDGIGALVAGNEFTNIRENGNHSDCLQTVWVGDHLVYRDNYLHDNRCRASSSRTRRARSGASASKTTSSSATTPTVRPARRGAAPPATSRSSGRTLG